MRSLVFLLVAANLVFFAWTQGYLGQRDNPDAVRLVQQLEAERLTVLSRDEPPKRKEAVPAKKAVAEKCVAWSGLAETDIGQLDTLLAEKFPDLKRVRHSLPEQSSWWVIIPPQANKADAEKKAAELKRLGVPEFHVIQDAGPNRWAISLGIFSGEQGANDRLEALKAKGVRSAKVAKRTVTREAQLSLEATGPEPLAIGAREAVAQVLPEAKSGACGN